VAFDPVLAERMREILEPVGPTREIKMFGGLCFTYQGNMVCGLMNGDSLILRLAAEEVASLIAQSRARTFEPMKGKPAKGMAVIDAAAELDDEPLQAWVDEAVAFVRTLPPKG
jgi:hypothetical protein